MPPYKYLTLFKALDIEEMCPCELGPLQKGKVYRWVRFPLSHELNFLPNRLYDERRGYTPRMNDTADRAKCLGCALSMFTSLRAAQTVFNSLSPSGRQGIGYTHIAAGVLDEGDGVCGKSDERGHFTFYEYEGVDLRQRFEIVAQLAIAA